MGFGEAVTTCMSKYATFSGRARRSEYWWFVVFEIVVLLLALGLDNVLHTTVNGGGVGWVYFVAVLALVIPNIAVTVRRLHDTGRSGWWWFLSLLCGIGALVVFVFCLLDTTPGPNQYGPSPKG
jgi:uncharacterized membrane protein YhaH (DUF805 family)